MKKLAVALIVLLSVAASANGGTIYIWTDENGVKRFSDAPPPKGIENYETAVGSTSKPAEGQREGLTKMLEEVGAARPGRGCQEASGGSRQG
jgi:hypothetical protein